MLLDYFVQNVWNINRCWLSLMVLAELSLWFWVCQCIRSQALPF